MNPSPLDQSDLLPNERSEIVQHLASLLTPEAKPTGLILIGLDLAAVSASGSTDPGLVGEHVMQQITKSIGLGVEPADQVSRLGLDQIAVVRSAIAAPSEADGMAYRLLESLLDPAEPNEAWRLKPSVGVATSLKGDSAPELVRYAEHALEQAQLLGGCRAVVFDDVDRDLLEPASGASVDAP